MTLIPAGTSFTSTAQAHTVKSAKCAGCGAQYVYLMTRAAHAQRFSFLFFNARSKEREAAADAEKAVARMLATECDPVPCPACGLYQPDMVARARQIRFHGMKTAWMYLLPAAVLFAWFGKIASTIRGDPAVDPIVWWSWMVTSLVFAGALPAARYLLVRNYDPNRRPVERRIADGKSVAMLKDEYERAIRAQAAS